MVPPCSDRISRVPPYLIRRILLPIRGCHPLWPCFPACSCHNHRSAGPRSLAATRGVSVDFLSSGYLDVSVPRVCSLKPMYSASKYLVQPIIDCSANNNSLSGGLPHSEIPGSKLILSSPGLIAEYHVLHRLLLPRHPPNALFALDLIQKEQGSHLMAPGWFDQRLTFRSEVIHFPLHIRRHGTFGSIRADRTRLVYLTWTKLLFQSRLQVRRQIQTCRHVVAMRSSPTGAISNSDV